MRKKIVHRDDLNKETPYYAIQFTGGAANAEAITSFLAGLGYDYNVLHHPSRDASDSEDRQAQFTPERLTVFTFQKPPAVNLSAGGWLLVDHQNKFMFAVSSLDFARDYVDFDSAVDGLEVYRSLATIKAIQFVDTQEVIDKIINLGARYGWAVKIIQNHIPARGKNPAKVVRSLDVDYLRSSVLYEGDWLIWHQPIPGVDDADQYELDPRVEIYRDKDFNNMFKKEEVNG